MPELEAGYRPDVGRQMAGRNTKKFLMAGKYPPGSAKISLTLKVTKNKLVLLHHAEFEVYFFRREDTCKEPFIHNRLNIKYGVHPLQHGKMRGNELFFQDLKLGFAFIVRPVVQFPFLVEFKFPVPDILVIIKRSY